MNSSIQIQRQSRAARLSALLLLILAAFGLVFLAAGEVGKQLPLFNGAQTDVQPQQHPPPPGGCPAVDYAKLGKQLAITERMIKSGQAPYPNYARFLTNVASQAGIETPQGGVNLQLIKRLWREVYFPCK